MSRETTAKKPSVTVPHRSANATRAYAANAVTSTIDLTQPASRITERAATVTSRSGMALALVAVGVWIYDIVRIAGR